MLRGLFYVWENLFGINEGKCVIFKYFDATLFKYK